MIINYTFQIGPYFSYKNPMYKTTDRSEYSHLFLEELVSHGKEGDGETASEEHNEVSSQLESVVDGEGKIVSWRRQTVPASPDDGGGEAPGGHDGTLGNLGKHLGSLVEVNQAIL